MPAFLSILCGIKILGDFLSKIPQWPTRLQVLLGGINSCAASLHWLYFLTGDCTMDKL